MSFKIMKLFKFSMFGLFMVGALIFANNVSAATGTINLQKSTCYYKSPSTGCNLEVLWSMTSCASPNTSASLKMKNLDGDIETIISGVVSGVKTVFIKDFILANGQAADYDQELQLYCSDSLLDSERVFASQPPWKDLVVVFGYGNDGGHTDANGDTVYTLSASIRNEGLTYSNSFVNSFQGSVDNGGGTGNFTGTTFATVSINGLAGGATKMITVNKKEVELPYNYWRVCASQPNAEGLDGNCGEWSPLRAYDPASLPDLIASAPAQTRAEIGVAKIFTSTIKNGGGESTEKGFSNFFQITTDKDDETKIEDLDAVSMDTLLDGASGVTSKSYTFTESGIYYVRACADKSNKSSLGDIVERVEDNNCSAWTRVAVSLSDLVSSAPTKISNAGFQGYVPTILTKKDTPFTVYAMIKNQGTSATESSFTNVFSTFADEPGDPEINYTVSGMNVLQVGGTAYYSATITFTKKGTYFLSSCADKNSMSGSGVIKESNENNNCATTDVIVSNKLKDLPELSTSLPTPSSAEAGVAETFTSSVFNQGTASTGIAFTNLFQTATLPNGGGEVIDYAVSGMADLAPLMMSDFTESITFPSAGTYYIRACADKSSEGDAKGVVEENEDDNNCSNWGEVTVTEGVVEEDGIDLIVSAPIPTGATAGVATMFFADVKNQGADPTGIGFTNLFQTAIGISNLQEPAGLLSYPVAGMQALSAGGTSTYSKSLTFATVGTYYMRACADKNSANGTGVITESNEDNNCSSWRAVTVGNVDNGNCSDEIRNGDETGVDSGGRCGNIETFEIDFYPIPTKIFRGKSSKLIWSAPLAESCSAVSETGYGEWSTGPTTPSGEVLVFPTKTTKYKISCSKEGVSNTAWTLVTVNSINIIER
jgi:hypothetical protein